MNRSVGRDGNFYPGKRGPILREGNDYPKRGKFCSYSDKQRNLGGKVGSTGYKNRYNNARDTPTNACLSESNRHSGEHRQQSVFLGPSDDAYDAAYLDVNEATSEQNRQESGHGRFTTQFQAPNTATFSGQEHRNLFLTDLDHCKTRQPVIWTRNCCLYPAREDSQSSPFVKYEEDVYHTILVSNMHPVMNEAMTSEIFGHCGKIDMIHLCEGEKDHYKSFYIKYSDKNAANAALRYDNHFIFVGNPNFGLVPEMLSRIHVDTVSDEVIEKGCLASQWNSYPMFSETSFSNTMSLLQSAQGFKKASDLIVHWLINGACTGYNINMFFGLITSANKFLGKIIETNLDLKDFRKSNKNLELQRAQSIIEQCDAIKNILAACIVHSVWVNFSEEQKDCIHGYSKNFTQESEVIEAELQFILNDNERKPDNSKIEHKICGEMPSEAWKSEVEFKMENEIIARDKAILDLRETKFTLESELSHLRVIEEKNAAKIDELRRELSEKAYSDQQKIHCQEKKEKELIDLRQQLAGLKKFLLLKGKASLIEVQDGKSENKDKNKFNGPNLMTECPAHVQLQSNGEGLLTDFDHEDVKCNNIMQLSPEEMVHLKQERNFEEDPHDRNMTKSVGNVLIKGEKQEMKPDITLQGKAETLEEKKHEATVKTEQTSIEETIKVEEKCDVLPKHEFQTRPINSNEACESATFSVLAIALNTYPNGATINDMKGYCVSNQLNVCSSTILDVLKKFPTLFEHYVDDNMNERWIFTGFKQLR